MNRSVQQVSGEISQSSHSQVTSWRIYLYFLSGYAKVKFKFGANKAATDGKNVYIPVQPLDMTHDEEYIFRSFAEHECGHCMFSNIPLFQAIASTKPFIGTLLNCVEDAWMEKMVAQKRPQAKKYFVEGLRLRRQQGRVKTGAATAAEALFVVVRSQGGVSSYRSDFQDLLEVSEGYLVSYLGQSARCVIDLIRGVIIQKIGYSTTTSDNLALTQLIYQVLRDFVEALGGSTKGLHGSSELKVVDGVTLLASGQTALGLPIFLEHMSRDTRTVLASNIIRMLNDSSTKGEVVEYGESVEETSANALSSGRPCSPADGSIDHVDNTSGQDQDLSGIDIASESIDHYVEAMHRISSKVSFLAQRLSQILRSRATLRRKLGYSGNRVNAGKSYRLSLGDTRVFLSEKSEYIPTAAVAVLCDLSGSTHGSCAIEIRQAAVLLCSALSYPGVNIPNSAWGFGCCNSDSLLRIKSFNDSFESSRARFGGTELSIGGTTPLAQALSLLHRQMASCSEEKRVIFVLTDGVPNDSDAAVNEVVQMKEYGIEIVHVVFGADCAWLAEANLYHVVCDNAVDIPIAVIKEVEKLV